MKDLVFVTHDPGGFDAVYPVYRMFRSKGFSCVFHSAGPSGVIYPEASVSDSEIRNQIEDVVTKNNCAALITGTSWGSQLETSVIQRCKLAGIPTFSILDYWSNYSSRFLDATPKYVYPHYLIVMDELARQEAINDGIPESILTVQGAPALDKWVNVNIQKKRSTYGKEHDILFLSQPLFELYGNTLGYSQYNVVEDVVSLTRDISGLSVSIKFHPKDSKELEQKYEALAVEGELVDLLAKSRIVIGMNSMALLFSTMAGAQTISYQPGLRVKDSCITNKLGLTNLIDSYQGLVSEVDRIHRNSQYHENTFGYTGEIPKSYIWSDGKSTERVYRFIKGVLQL